MNNARIIDYHQFRFNDEFIPNINIFNVNTDTHVGIGTHNPKEKLEISNSIDIQGNIIILHNTRKCQPPIRINFFIIKRIF